MEKSFAGLLRNSRLARYDRKLAQVYCVSRENQQKGNWGLKRNLPSVIRTPFVTISDLDTAEHQTPWRSGTDQVMFVRRWKENFVNSKKPVPRPEHVEHNVALMTPAQFKNFVKQAAKRSPDFRQKLQDKVLKKEQIFEYLGVTFNDSPANGVVGPTYSDHQVEMSYPVQGRFLNNDREGYAVGIGGVVALCFKRYVSNPRLHGDRRQRTFYVEEASIDPQGRPHVVVSPYQPGVSSIPEILGGENAEGSSLNGMKAEDLWNTSRVRQERPMQDKPDNVQANPKHKELMECLDVFTDKYGSKKN
ncbi:hypothetical protein RO3G_08491 [Lichtheimia corymbifera JMRC:FSU:9682]|uniref:Uncharacterized protein n=1 Tax=Lichtheimia corymbifera JMRC:FSU:9682 TaxID=1263082 RepID=A0A068S221_9FUNG|nr:hypothetical protein RO3G_08491 [Lichtheimia corymbifera JMRC:FSU:9682]